ncbi:histidine phosphatase superfamily [Flagelloscypha sp. PMI_526]|nr:histidine phosphatase superfamily [Flagelloscypha sp. PMI_526]
MVKRIYIIRHGFRLSWITNMWKSETGLARDPPLAAIGVTQAEEVATYFQSLPLEDRPTAIFSSPYYRCLQTAKPTSESLNLPILIEHGLSEWFISVREGTGLHPRPYNATALHKYFPTISKSYSSILYPPRTGESISEVHDRSEELLSHLVEIATASGHENILLVSHAATVAALVRVAVGDREMGVRVGCCSLSVLEKDEESVGGWKAVKVADGVHLIEGAQRDWGFEDVMVSPGKTIDEPGEPVAEGDGANDPVGLQKNLLKQTIPVPKTKTRHLHPSCL